MHTSFRTSAALPLLTCLAIAAAASWPCRAGAEVFSITANSCLVVGQDQATDQQAASELQDYLERMTGRKLPIEHDGAVPAGRYVIAVGDNSYTAPLADRLASLKRDSFIISSTPQALLLRGKPKTIRHPADFPAIDYAVSYFLQTYCGVRWYLPAPGDLGTVVPQRADILLSEFVDVQQPDFTVRLWGGLIDKELETAWNRHNRSGAAYVIHHSMTGIVANRPEFFALFNGQRSPQGCPQVCTANPDLVRFLADYAKQYFDTASPDVDVISMGQDDSRNYCECAACLASGTSISDRFYPFYAEIGKQLQVKHSGKKVGLLCYADAKALPSGDATYEHIAIALPWDRSAWFDRTTRTADEAFTREWSKRVGRVYLWNWYHNSGFITPQVFPRTVDRVIKFAKSLDNCDGMYSETYSHIALSGPKLWVLAQLQWNSSTPVEVLLDDFCTGMFGKGGPWMRRYYDLQEEAWCRQKVTDPDLFDQWRGNITQLDLFSPRDMQKQRDYLTKAAAAADTTADQARVDMMAKAFTQFDLSWRLYQEMKKASEVGRIDRARKAAAAEVIIASLFERHQELAEFQKTVVAPRPELQYFLGDWWTPAYEWFIADLAGYLTRLKEPDRLRAVMERLSRDYPDLAGAQLAAAIGQARGLPSAGNLMINADLEPLGSTVNGLARDDWALDAACPAGWYRWPKDVRNDALFRRADSSGSDRQYTGLKGPYHLYVQVAKVDPGKRYLVSFEAFPQLSAPGASGGTFIQYWQDKTNWLELNDAERAAGVKGGVTLSFNTGVENGRWHRMVGTLTVPPRAEYLVWQLVGRYLGRDDYVLFRNLQLFPLENAAERAAE
jgi:hypothetical protein